jgi:chemotaxis protein MotB
MPKRKKSGEGSMEMESGGMMRWLLTYADLITLLLATFVILFAMAQSSAAEKMEIMAQFRHVFGPIEGSPNLLPSQGANNGDHYKIIPGQPEEGGPGGPKKPTAPAAKGKSIEAELRSKLQYQLGVNHVSIRKEARGLVISLLTDKVLFDLGDTRLKPEMKGVLSDIAEVLKHHPDKQIAVEGHTDDLAIQSTRVPSNWELSALRATSVVEYFVTNKGMDPSRFSAAGYAEYQPLVPNISEANRRINRRVDIIILKLD